MSDVLARSARLRENMTLENLFHIICSSGDQVAARYLEGDEERQITYAEYEQKAYAIAAFLRNRIGVVPQKAQLFKGTIRENLLWGRKDATDEELYEALAIAQAEGFVREKGGLDAPVEQGGKNFSGGQKQRLTVARALVRKPEILILDDSSSALDYATDSALRKEIKKLQTTVIIVSQRASSVKDADKIIVLEDGKAVDMGKHEGLMQTSEVYREIYYSQYETGEVTA